jgi:hypothetical protein
MVERPTAQWREQVADEKAGLTSGALDPDDAIATELWPELMIQETDKVLDRFDTAVADVVEHRFEAALAARHRMTRHEITDEWREW